MDERIFQEAGRRLEGWRRTMILTHHRPDADALGSSAAMRRVIEAGGRQATAFIYEDVPPRYAFIETIGGFEPWPDGLDAGEIDARFDGILILDTCSWTQLEPAAAFLRASRLPKVVLDHHATRDDLTVSNTDDEYAIDPAAASACNLVHEWCDVMGWHVDAGAGEALFAGITADTGWFRFSNTDARTLRAGADLIERCGLRPDIIYARLNASHAPARLRLMCHMLGTLRLAANGAVAVVELTREMFERAGAQPADAEDLVNVPMETGSVMATALLTDMGDGVVRMNLRSKSPELIGREIDVSAVARRFGGGGHRRAAGARQAGALPQVREQVVHALEQVVGYTA